jgi:hypothetical protein
MPHFVATMLRLNGAGYVTGFCVTSTSAQLDVIH